LGDKTVAVTAVSPIYPPEEIEEAKKIAQEIGIKHMLIESHELADENFVRNLENRCYYCKKELLGCLRHVAEKLGFKAIFEGTNFSDLSGHRPGFKAVQELENVYSPWAQIGFTKEEIRMLSKRLGLSISDKPPMACLSTRIPYGEIITVEKLIRVAKAERVVKEIVGVRQLRIRDHNGLARIEVGKEERKLFFDLNIMDKIASELRGLGFKYVTIDLEGYRPGSMLPTLKNNKK
jgi:uncharacterized protein